MELKPAKKLGFGMMRLPVLDENDSTTIDIEQVKKMVDLFMERGFTYFDTAWMYHSFKSEEAVKEALVERHPRDSFTLATKMHSAYFNSVEERENVFNEQLRKTGAGYFDYYLLHALSASSFKKHEEFDSFGWLKAKKDAGLVRHIGFSFHDSAEVLDEILTAHPEVEFVQIQLNYLDWNSDSVQSRLCYETIVRHGKYAVIMEPVKGGSLANIPQEAEEMFRNYAPEYSIPSWAIRFAASLENVMVVLSGMSSLSQMDDNTSYMQNFVPLSEEENEMCLKAAEIINTQAIIPCTACHYCTDGCPMNIAIPEYFAIYNDELRKRKGHRQAKREYVRLNEDHGKASECLQCGQCEGVCPQHLSIIEYLQTIAEEYEDED